VDYPKSKAVGKWFANLKQRELRKVSWNPNLECNFEFEQLLKVYDDKNSKNIDAKQM
jgi:hypothetical protein